MPKIIETKKGFSLITATQDEVVSQYYRSFGIKKSIARCEVCESEFKKGVYVCILDMWLCSHCFDIWYETAKEKQQDEDWKDQDIRLHFAKDILFNMSGLNLNPLL